MNDVEKITLKIKKKVTKPHFTIRQIRPREKAVESINGREGVVYAEFPAKKTIDLFKVYEEDTNEIKTIWATNERLKMLEELSEIEVNGIRYKINSKEIVVENGTLNLYYDVTDLTDPQEFYITKEQAGELTKETQNFLKIMQIKYEKAIKDKIDLKNKYKDRAFDQERIKCQIIEELKNKEKEINKLKYALKLFQLFTCAFGLGLLLAIIEIM